MTGREEELAEVARWAEGIEQVHSCIAGRFRRPEPRRRVLDYLRGLVSSVERKNGWQLAEQAGDATPDGVQRLLYNYRWDADLVRDDLKSYVVEHLSAADAVLVVDETGCPASTIFAGWRQSVLPVHLLGVAPLLGSVGAVAGDVKLQDDGVMDHPVDCRGGGHGVGEDAFPLREDQV